MFYIKEILNYSGGGGGTGGTCLISNLNIPNEKHDPSSTEWKHYLLTKK